MFSHASRVNKILQKAQSYFHPVPVQPEILYMREAFSPSYPVVLWRQKTALDCTKLPRHGKLDGVAAVPAIQTGDWIAGICGSNVSCHFAMWTFTTLLLLSTLSRPVRAAYTAINSHFFFFVLLTVVLDLRKELWLSSLPCLSGKYLQRLFALVGMLSSLDDLLSLAHLSTSILSSCDSGHKTAVFILRWWCNHRQNCY